MRLQFRDSPRHVRPLTTRDLLPEDRVVDDKPDEQSRPPSSPVPTGQARELVGTYPAGNYFLTGATGGTVTLWRSVGSNGAMRGGSTANGEATGDSAYGSPSRVGDRNPVIAKINAANRRAWGR